MYCEHHAADDQQPHRPMSPRQRQHLHDNSCHDNSCHGDHSGRPVSQGGLIRSRSDETVNNNMSFVVTHGRRRRSSTVRRRHKKTTTTTTDRLITEFNEGKEIDLDRLTSARGIYTRACDDLARPSSSHRLEIDFNEGKDFDLDRLTSARGSASRTCDDMTGPQSSESKFKVHRPVALDLVLRE